MAWTDLLWTTGWYITQTRQRDQYNNIVHVREEAAYWTIVTDGPEQQATADVAGSTQPTFDLEIDTTPIGSGVSTVGAKSELDIDISGFSDGLHVLHCITSTTGGSAELDREYRFYKTPDMDWLSYWVTLSIHTTGGNNGGESAELTVITHRETGL